MKTDKYIFGKPEHFYPKNRHEPVSKIEDESETKKIKMAKLSFFLLVMTIIFCIEYFSWWIVDEMGYKLKSLPIIFFLILIFVAVVLIFILSGEKMDEVISGKIIEKNQEIIK